MTDITKCSGNQCELKDSCYRYLAKASTRQSYADFDLKLIAQKELNINHQCEHYWEVKSVYQN